MRLLLGLLAATTLLCAADTKYGKPLTLKEPITLAAMYAHADEYAGKTVQVQGKIAEVCQAMGCWLEMVDNDGHHLRFNAHDEIEFPKDSAGRTAIAEGKLLKDTDTKDAKPTYSMQGTGAVILSQ
jgi:hypothetical protein